MKFNLTPRLHCLFDLRQFTQFGKPSSHFRCRSLQVKQPVRTLLGRDAAALASNDTGVTAFSVAAIDSVSVFLLTPSANLLV